jgi:hypothetical protein
MRSIGIELDGWIKKKLLRIHASRPTLTGLEQHLVSMHDLIDEFDPSLVVVDPISNLTFDEMVNEVKANPYAPDRPYQEKRDGRRLHELDHRLKHRSGNLGGSAFHRLWIRGSCCETPNSTASETAR